MQVIQTIDLALIAVTDGCLGDLPTWLDATPDSIHQWAAGYIETAAETWEIEHDATCSEAVIAANVAHLEVLGWQTINDRQHVKEIAEIHEEWNYDRNGRYVGPSEAHFYHAV